MGKLMRMIAGDGSVVCIVMDSTDVVARMEQIHQTSATVTAALGRLLTAAAMMGSMMKNKEDNVTVRFAGDGPSGILLAVSDSDGNPRGYVENPVVEIPLNKFGKLDVAGAVGSEGTLSVSKDFGGPEPTTGTVPIISGEIAEDITSYYAASEQIPTVCALGVLVNPDLSVLAAGGFLVQLLPGAGEDVIERLEENLDGMSQISTLIHEGMTPEAIGRKLLSGFEPEVLDERDTVYRCNCSKERVERALVSLGREELEDMAREQETTEVCCHFCDKKYRYSSQELLRLIK